MDPDTVVDELRSVAQLAMSIVDADYPLDGQHGQMEAIGEELAEKFLALDEWLSRGGFPPKGWGEQSFWLLTITTRKDQIKSLHPTEKHAFDRVVEHVTDFWDRGEWGPMPTEEAEAIVQIYYDQTNDEFFDIDEMKVTYRNNQQ